MLNGAFEHGYSVLCNLYASAKLRKEMEEEKLKQAAAIQELSVQADKDRKLYEQKIAELTKQHAEDSKRRAEDLKRLQKQLKDLENQGGGGFCVIL